MHKSKKSSTLASPHITWILVNKTATWAQNLTHDNPILHWLSNLIKLLNFSLLTIRPLQKKSVQQYSGEMCQGHRLWAGIKSGFRTLARPPSTMCFLTFAPVHKIWTTIFTWAPRYNQNMACMLFRVYSLHMHELSYQCTQPKKIFSWWPSSFNQHLIIFVEKA